MNITIELEGKKYAGVLAVVDETPTMYPPEPVSPVVEPTVPVEPVATDVTPENV